MKFNETCPHSCVPIDDIRIYNTRDSSFELSCPDCIPQDNDKVSPADIHPGQRSSSISKGQDYTTNIPESLHKLPNNVPVGAGTLHDP